MTDPLDDPNYQQWLSEIAEKCQASDKPCGGCQQGGVCDGAGGGILSEDYEDKLDDADLGGYDDGGWE